MSLQDEILEHKATVTLNRAVNGYWDGGRKQSFEFNPSIERTRGVPAIRWGSYAANLWFVIPEGKSLLDHLERLRRKLRGGIPRKIEFIRQPAMPPTPEA